MFSIEEDFEIIDGLEAATIIQAGTAKRQLMQKAFPSPVTNRDAIGSDGTYRQGDLKFTFTASELELFLPVAGDFIEDFRKQIWTIGTVEEVVFRTQFRCWARCASLNPALAVPLNIYSPLYVKDATGASVIRWELFAELSGHVNEAVSKIEIDSGRKRLAITHQIYITDARANDIQAGWRITDGQGGIWNCQRVTNKGNMGQATILDVETARTPVKN